MKEIPNITAPVHDDHLEVDCPSCDDGINTENINFYEEEAEVGNGGPDALTLRYLSFLPTECECYSCGQRVIVTPDDDHALDYAWDNAPKRDKELAMGKAWYL